MRAMLTRGGIGTNPLWLALLFCGCLGAAPQAAAEQTFDLLQLETRGVTNTYRNVTVTTRNKEYVFLIHSGGMENIKVSDLSTQALQELGYMPKVKVPTTNVTTKWAKQAIGTLEKPEVKQFEKQLNQQWHNRGLDRTVAIPKFTAPFVLGVFGFVFGMYMFYSYCCMLICQKAGTAPGFLVWLPILKQLPLLTAAGMSRWWILSNLVPVLNLVGAVIWCFKIADARGKSALIGFLLLLPVTNILALLYLAFSGSASDEPKKPQRGVQLMRLEAA